MKIPEGVSLQVVDGKIIASGPKGSVEKTFDARTASVEVQDGVVSVRAVVSERRRTSASVNAIAAHIRNMLAGVSQGFEKKLQVVYAHFPMSIEVKGTEVLIKNFLGEKSPRAADVLPGVQVKVDKQEIIVSGANRESVGQTAANIVQAVRITNRDKRVFQDGIYVA